QVPVFVETHQVMGNAGAIVGVAESDPQAMPRSVSACIRLQVVIFVGIGVGKPDDVERPVGGDGIGLAMGNQFQLRWIGGAKKLIGNAQYAPGKIVHAAQPDIVIVDQHDGIVLAVLYQEI